MEVRSYLYQAIDFMGFYGYCSRPNYVQDFSPSETLGERRWMEEERERRKQEIKAERNKPMTKRVREAAPRFLEALSQRSFPTLFLIALFIIAFSPVLCVLSVFGSIGFLVTAWVLAIQIFSVLLLLTPFVLLALVVFVGIFSTTMAIMVTVKCINAFIQRLIRAYLCLRNALLHYLYQVQDWYKETCRLVFDMYLNIIRIIFFPFVVAEYIRHHVINTVYTLFINPVTWVVCLPFNMVNAVVEVIFIILGVQGSTRSRQQSRRCYYHDVQQPRSRQRQPMNAPKLLLAALDKVLPCDDLPDEVAIPDVDPDYSTWDNRYYDMIVRDHEFASA